MSFDFSTLPLQVAVRSALQSFWMQRQGARLISLAIVAIVTVFCWTHPAWAALTDDRYDGEIFALYAGNGSLVPSKVKLADSLNQGKPAILVFYLDDSQDSKRFSSVVSQLQASYGRVADFLLVRVDALPAQENYAPTEAGHYYRGYVPQTLVFDQTGQVRLDEIGQVPFEQIDDAFRQIFDLLPRSESVALKRRSVNEVSTELVPQP